MNKVKRSLQLIIFIFMLSVFSCVSINGDKIVDTSYKILSTTQIAYDNSMCIIADLYRDGKITEQEKLKVIEIGNKFVGAYKILVSCLESYSKGVETPLTLEQATYEFTSINNELMTYIGQLINKE